MLKRTASSNLYRLFRNCSLAVLNSGSQTDNSKQLPSRYETFDINVLSRERGVKLELLNPPEEAFVDGRIIRSLQANLFAVLRDILFVYGQIASVGHSQHLNLENQALISPTWYSPFCAIHTRCIWMKIPIWWCVGAATRSTRMNTSTHVRSAANWVCAS
ncbi:DUF4478 family protein [Serratia symbiotica]|nr:DUF4478 family protein [Serratia symbiotica]